MRKSAQWIIGLAISLAALAWAFRDVRLSALFAALQSANYVYLLPALGLILIGQMARARSWQTILGHRVPFWRVFGALNAGYLLNNVLPFRLGEVGRAYLISRTQKLTATQALSSVLVERVIDLVMILSILAAFLPVIAGLDWTRNAAVISAVVTLLALAGLFVLARSPAAVTGSVHWMLSRIRLPGLSPDAWSARVGHFIEGLAVLQDGRRLVAAAFWSSMAWVCAGFSAWLLIIAFVPGGTLAMGFFMLVITGLSIAVPSAPGSLGVWQAAGVSALGVFGVAGGVAFSISLVHHLVNYGFTSLLGAAGLAREGESLSHLAQSARALLGEKEQKGVVPPPPSTQGDP